MPDKAWKKRERDVANYFNGQRTPLSGGNGKVTRADVIHEELFDFVVENGSEDYELNDDEYNIYCDQKILHQLNQKIIERFGPSNFTGLIWKSENDITVTKDKADTLFKLLNILEENEDVQAVFSNFDVSDEVLASLTA